MRDPKSCSVATEKTAPKPIPSSTLDAAISPRKRTQRSAGDEAAGDEPNQQSPARKKKRTLWDGSLSWKEVTDLIPPSIRRRYSGNDSIRSPPNVAAPPRVSTYAPSPLSEPVHCPPPNACGHPIHPAYSNSYAKAMCPMCLVDASMKALQHIQDIINVHGGLSQWNEKTKGSRYHTTFRVATVGGKKGRQPRWRDRYGRDISYRHCKRNLINLVNELEDLAEMEVVWEENQSPENNDVYVGHVRLRKQYSATAALHWYKDTEDNGFIGRIEEDCELFGRRRGRRWTITCDPDFPDRGGREQELGWKSLMRTQHQLLNASKIPKTLRTDVAEQLPRRKRRREGAGVSWNEDAYVRTYADVDVLLKAACSLSEDFLEPSPKRPNLSILRTTPLAIDQEHIAIDAVANYSKPMSSHHVIPLSRKDGPPRDVTQSSMARRKRRLYTRGQWAVPEGSGIIDTSGCYKGFDFHRAYMEDLQIEAVRMDKEDRLRGDVEMTDASAADAQTSTPQPSSWSPSRLISRIASLRVFNFAGFERPDLWRG
jgi:hypothetical protein